ncbi:FtsK/SpoIIIE domain-containing protein [Lysinibacillus sp. NPDC093712]|uniref:FtsK/SpoIIIE domain-containing protein n=1 Tax=Lysinibacillus sp. NPDC093712 TaxID=3390579 RepID=UPI003D007586
MSILRIFQPSVVENEKYANYDVSLMPPEQVKDILSSNFIDGVFGVEFFRIANKQTIKFFCPPPFQLKGTKHKSTSSLYININKDNSIYAQFYLRKSSMFPIEMNCTESFWKLLTDIIPSHINIKYQLLLVYRQDNWRKRIIDQYDDYLNGVQNPSDNGMFRKVQRSFTEKMDELLRWEQKHSEIKEVGKKLEENGYRFNIRLVLIGGTKKERISLIDKVTERINEFSYTNHWIADSKLDFDDMSELFNKRKLDFPSKNYVLSTSEILPFITINQTLQESVSEVSRKNVSDIVEDKRLSLESVDGSLMELLPKGNEIDLFDGTDIANKFVYALKEIKPFRNEMKLVRYQSGSTTLKITFNLPKQLKFSEISKVSVINDVQMKMGVKQLQIKQGEDVGEVDVILPLDKRQKVFLRNYIDTEPFKEFVNNNPLPFLVGVDEIGNPIYQCISKIKHLLVAGSTGSGKSVWLNQLILTLLIVKNSSELQMVMIDIKQVELVQFSSFEQVQKVVTNADEATHLLKQLIKEMDRRYELFKSIDVKNIALYNKRVKYKLPYIVCVIDEYAELKNRNSDIDEYVQSLTQLSRASGIHLILATQRPSVDIISGVIKSNLPSKIGFRCANKRSYLTFLNTAPKFDLLGNGDGIMDFEGQSEEHIRFQGCLIVDDPNDENLENRLIKNIANQSKNEKVSVELPEIEEVETELDRVRKIILETGICKVGELRGIVKMNINKLNEIMKQLADEGMLIHPETRQSGYRINPEYNKNSSNN